MLYVNEVGKLGGSALIDSLVSEVGTEIVSSDFILDGK